MEVKQKLLTKNAWSRPGRKVHKIRAIVLHWTAGPKDTPEGVYSWFEQRKKGKTGFGSAHFCVGMDGETMQFLPQDEMAYHVGSKTYTEEGLALSRYPNDCTLGIEMCPINIEGEFTDSTWNATVELTAALLKEYGLTTDNITTHQKIVGWKDCPRWFVRFPKELDRFKEDVKKSLDGLIGRVNVSKLNMRDNPNGKKIKILKIEDTVYIEGIKDGWLKVINENDTGWVLGKYIK